MLQALEDDCELSPELQCLFALREAELSFQDDIISHARATVSANPGQQLTPEEFDLLRSTECQHIAEFYYLAKKYNLSDRANVRSFLLRHNNDLRVYIEDKEKREALGIPKSRLEEGLFSEPQIQKVIYYTTEGKLCLDQSDLGRLLTKLQSAETTRKTIVALAKAGLLTRINTGRVLIVSNGMLEDLFEKQLKLIVASMQQEPIGRRSAEGKAVG